MTSVFVNARLPFVSGDKAMVKTSRRQLTVGMMVFGRRKNIDRAMHLVTNSASALGGAG